MDEQEKEPTPFEVLAAEVREKFARAVSDDLRNFNADHIRAQLLERLTEQQDKILMTMLGLDTSFGSVRIDSRNSSLADQLIQQHAGEVATKWLESAMGKALQGEFKLTEKQQAQLRAHVKEKMRWGFDRTVSDLAYKKGQELAQKMIEANLQELTETLGLEPGSLQHARKDRW